MVYLKKCEDKIYIEKQKDDFQFKKVTLSIETYTFIKEEDRVNSGKIYIKIG